MRVECKSVRPLAMRVHSAHSKIRVHAEQSIKRWLRGKKNNNKSRPRERAFRLLELVSPIPKFPKRVRFMWEFQRRSRENTTPPSGTSRFGEWPQLSKFLKSDTDRNKGEERWSWKRPKPKAEGDCAGPQTTSGIFIESRATRLITNIETVNRLSIDCKKSFHIRRSSGNPGR